MAVFNLHIVAANRLSCEDAHSISILEVKEGPGEEAFDRETAPSAQRPAVGDPNLRLGSVFSEELAAGAAGHRPARDARDHRDGEEIPFTGSQRAEKSDALGAAGQAEAGALDVGASDDGSLAG